MNVFARVEKESHEISIAGRVKSRIHAEFGTVQVI